MELGLSTGPLCLRTAHLSRLSCCGRLRAAFVAARACAVSSTGLHSTVHPPQTPDPAQPRPVKQSLDTQLPQPSTPPPWLSPNTLQTSSRLHGLIQFPLSHQPGCSVRLRPGVCDPAIALPEPGTDSALGHVCLSELQTEAQVDGPHADTETLETSHRCRWRRQTSRHAVTMQDEEAPGAVGGGH